MTTELWRRLGATEPLFSLIVPGSASWDDHGIGSWSTTLGGDDLGVLTSTATATVRGEIIPARDPDFRISLTPAGAALVAGLCGNRTDAELTDRYWGRFAGSTVEDRPGRSATLHAADLLALAASVNPTIGPLGGGFRNLGEMYGRVWGALGLPAYDTPAYYPEPAPGTGWDGVRNDTGWEWSEVADKYAKQAGSVVYMDRAGNLHARNMIMLQDAAYTWGSTGEDLEPLARRQCVAPAAWESVLSPAKHVRGTLWDGTTTSTYPSGKPPASLMSRIFTTETLDLTHLVDRTGCLTRMLDGLWQRVNDTRYHVPTVTVDLLRLLGSEHAHDRAQAGYLLTLDPFGIVALGKDWPDHVRGLYYASTITETVTPTSWTITVGLLPSMHVHGVEYGAPPGRTWGLIYNDTTEWDAGADAWTNPL